MDEAQDPLFTGTNIAFNWGGASNKVESVKAQFVSRTHNEQVVYDLDFYIDYLTPGPYRMEDDYGRVPYALKINKDANQISGKVIELVFLDQERFVLNLFDSESTAPQRYIQVVNYKNQSYEYEALEKDFFERIYFVGEGVHNSLFDFDVVLNDEVYPGDTYFFRFNNFDSTVGRYRGVSANDYLPGTSLIFLQMAGPNKKRMVDYLNRSVEILDQNMKEIKISYAVRTKNYIDTLFLAEEKKLKSIEKKIEIFKQENESYNLSSEASYIFQKVKTLDQQSYDLSLRLKYYENLKSYLSVDTNIPDNIIAPSLVDIEDPNIALSTGKLIELSQTRSVLVSSVTEDHPAVVQVNKDIEREKRILEEHIDEMIGNISRNIEDFEKEMSQEKSEIKTLPAKEQELINYQRNQALNESTYSFLKQKSYEAGSAIASNTSELKVIDTAKDTGQGPISPNTDFNYMVAFLTGLIFPLLYAITRELLNDKIDDLEDLKNKFSIPVIGTVGSVKDLEHLGVFSKPKSSFAESFRILRSNMYFLLKNKTEHDSKVVLVTSSISGEGKTTVAANLATVFAISGKKTLLINMDLRKPRLHEEFDMKNDFGAVNLLVDKDDLDTVKIATKVNNLDVIFSGPTPPNPSELIVGPRMGKFIDQARSKYSRIVIDSSPMGLVSDTLELFQYADSTLYVIRQDFTRKGMLKMVEEKYENGSITNISYVLNFYKAAGKYGYGYDYGKYGYGYVEDNEIPFYRKIFKRKNAK
jgi:capsular exopolysaccharide synthesis family protein